MRDLMLFMMRWKDCRALASAQPCYCPHESLVPLIRQSEEVKKDCDGSNNWRIPFMLMVGDYRVPHKTFPGTIGKGRPGALLYLSTGTYYPDNISPREG